MIKDVEEEICISFRIKFDILLSAKKRVQQVLYTAHLPRRPCPSQNPPRFNPAILRNRRESASPPFQLNPQSNHRNSPRRRPHPRLTNCRNDYTPRLRRPPRRDGMVPERAPHRHHRAPPNRQRREARQSYRARLNRE